MKHSLQTLAALMAVGALVAASIVGFGLYNVSARQNHLPGVAWVLHTTFKQSVRLRAPSASEVPDDLADPDRIGLGALHFQTACAFCHAVPGQSRSATALSMNPPPPHISEAVSNWEPQHMFWIVREGVKMSGMPHWPAPDRTDEVWSVVAYLDAVRDMDAQQQRVLKGEDIAASTCTQCHGEAGRSANSFIPRLDILTVDQISAALTQYRDGTRPSGIMTEAASHLSDAQIGALAARLGKRAPPTITLPAATSGGSLLATRGTDDVPACTACHGPGRTSDAPIAPSLAGQSRAFLERQLHLWKDGQRGGGIRSQLMQKAAQDLTVQDIETLAAWYASLQDGMDR